MGNILVINDRNVDFSAVAVKRVSFLNDGPVIKVLEDNIATIIPFEYTVATYYTTDGSEPTSSSNAYNAPFVIPIGTTVKAVSVYPDGHYTEISTLVYIGWHEVDLSQYDKTEKSISARLEIVDMPDYFDGYIIPVTSGKTMRITACVWGSTTQYSLYSPCAVYFNSRSMVSSSIIGAVNIAPTTVIDEKTAACYNKEEFTIPSNTPYLFIQGRTQGNVNFIDGYDLKLEECN